MKNRINKTNAPIPQAMKNTMTPINIKYAFSVLRKLIDVPSDSDNTPKRKNMIVNILHIIIPAIDLKKMQKNSINREIPAKRNKPEILDDDFSFFIISCS